MDETALPHSGRIGVRDLGMMIFLMRTLLQGVLPSELVFDLLVEREPLHPSLLPLPRGS